jgi:predicted nucleotidyltransferase
LPRSRDHALLESIRGWAATDPDVFALALVGSRARGDEQADSDIDLVLLTERPERFVEREDWATNLGGSVVATRKWGVVTERRVRLTDGSELDVGVAPRSWAHVSPIDGGTLRVVLDGLKVLHDPAGLLRTLLEAADTTRAGS